MNSPEGVTLDSAGNITDVDPLGVIFNEAMPLMAAHMVVRRAARLRRGRADHQARQRHHRPGRRAGRLRRAPVARRHELRVRFRIDGVLMDSATVPRRMISGVISRVKIMSDLDISERRVPQDGRVGITIDGHHVDLRVVSLPSVHGESIVMRILDQSEGIPELGKLGFADGERERFEKAFRQAYGAVLVTGPTGSGKSTSLYAALGEVNTPRRTSSPSRIRSSARSTASRRCRSTRAPA